MGSAAATLGTRQAPSQRRSPWQLAAARIRRDRVALFVGVAIVDYKAAWEGQTITFDVPVVEQRVLQPA
jgi:hypothetical protein